MAADTIFRYSGDFLRSLNIDTLRPTRPMPKSLFRNRLWRSRKRPDLLSRDNHNRTPRQPSSATEPTTESAEFGSSCHSDLRIGSLNVRSINNKHAAISELIVENKMNIFVACETWHHSADDVSVRRAMPPGYSCIESARVTDDPEKTNHGGIVVFIRSG